MSDISRQEFDRLVERVERIERTLSATVELVAAEVVGLRTHMDERFDAVDGRFDAVDGRFDSVERSVAETRGAVGELAVVVDEGFGRVDRTLRAITRHLGVDEDGET